MYKTDIFSKWFNKKVNDFFKTNLSTRESDIFMFTGIFSALVIFVIFFYCVIMPNL
nr:MAG TPA: Sporulation protein Cse60 [Caudoviricetes sp.]